MPKFHRRGVGRVLTVLTLAAMLVTWLPFSVSAESRADVIAASELRQAGPKPGGELLPAEVLDAFEDGMAASELVAMGGYVPHALESLVDDSALVIIQMEGQPAAAIKAAAGGRPGISASLSSQISALEAAQASLQAQIEPLGAKVISNYTVVYNGIQARVPLSQLAAIREMPGVVAVRPAPVHEPALGASVPLMGADQVWEDLGVDGDGIVIAVIDTGIDYTHVALGGSGNPLQYELNDPDWVEPGTFPTAKVVGGYDFAGTLYDGSNTPSPDEDPLDEYGHGTHVASIAAGVAAGDVMTGTAPGAGLMALKVFGQQGSTTLTLDALEYATQHYLQWGWPQVINMSLGAPFGVADENDPSVYGANQAASVGIVVVASAGNEGDVEYITGSPAVADKAISVAATTTGYVTGPTVNIVSPDYVTQTNIVYQPPSFDDDTGHFQEGVTATLAYVGNLAGADDDQLCSVSGIAADALDGQIALISRGSCAFSDKVNNAASLGAVAALIFNNTSGVITMAGTPVTIPAASIQQGDGQALIPADGKTAVISAESDVTTVEDRYTSADVIADFTSRGPRGYDSALKPDVSAPGVAIFAADMASGDGGVSMSGTSMAAPHVAGVAALIKQAHPDWAPEQVKAALMNTVDPAYDEDDYPALFTRSGMGRVDASRAVTTTMLAIADEDLVGLNWGVVASMANTVTLTGTVTVHNLSTEALLYETALALHPYSEVDGLVNMTVDPITGTIPGSGSVDLTVTVDVDMTEVSPYYGYLEEYSGAVSVYGGEAAEHKVALPFYFQLKPYTSLEIESSGVITHPLENMAVITATHSGPVASALWVYPALIVNDTPNPALEGSGDVRMFGMDYWESGSYGPILDIAINTWDWWHVPQPYFAEFDLYVDSDRDGTDDYVLFNYNYGAISSGKDDNMWIVVLVDLATGMTYLGSPWTIWTDFNASYMEWWVPASVVDVAPGSSVFDYQLVSWDASGTPGVHPRRTHEALNSPFAWMVLADPGPAAPVTNVLVAADSLAAYRTNAPEGVMIVDYVGDPRNQDGAQAYLAPVEILWKYQTFQPMVMRNWDGVGLR
ncbi:MAG: S8 family serine peptidase [Anaerolineae bacterium]